MQKEFTAAGKTLAAREQTEIHPSGEGLLCGNCATGTADDLKFSASSRASLDKLMSWQGEMLQRLRLSRANFSEIWKLLKIIIRSTLNKELRTFKYVEDI